MAIFYIVYGKTLLCCSDNTITIRAHDERQVFTESGGLGGGAPFCLANAPVLFHLQVVMMRMMRRRRMIMGMMRTVRMRLTITKMT